MKELYPCKRCHAIPRVVEVTGLFYVQCTGECKKKLYTTTDSGRKNVRIVTAKCDKWGAYEFLGATRTAAIAAWNDANSKRTINEED